MTNSIVWKLTLFVGVVVALYTGLLTDVAYVTTSEMLRVQIHDRLTTLAADRQGLLVSALRDQEQRAQALANWAQIRSLLNRGRRAARLMRLNTIQPRPTRCPNGSRGPGRRQASFLERRGRSLGHSESDPAGSRSRGRTPTS
jgi:hypothetical protein